jgi:hypothetical protein
MKLKLGSDVDILKTSSHVVEVGVEASVTNPIDFDV